MTEYSQVIHKYCKGNIIAIVEMKTNIISLSCNKCANNWNVANGLINLINADEWRALTKKDNPQILKPKK